jgi:hypothetical protein
VGTARIMRQVLSWIRWQRVCDGWYGIDNFPRVRAFATNTRWRAATDSC